MSRALIAAVSALSIAGCSWFVKKDPPSAPDRTGSPIVEGAEFNDLPVPLNFTQVRERSRIVQNPGFRKGTVVYQGAARLEMLRDWYKKAMPAKNWSPVPGAAGETGVGPYTLRFEKGVERCEVLLEAPADVTFVSMSVGLK